MIIFIEVLCYIYRLTYPTQFYQEIIKEGFIFDSSCIIQIHGPKMYNLDSIRIDLSSRTEKKNLI